MNKKLLSINTLCQGIGAIAIGLSFISPVKATTLISPDASFSTEFVVISSVQRRTAVTHRSSTINLAEDFDFLFSNLTNIGIPHIFVSAEETRFNRHNWQLDITYTTGSNLGFLPPNITFGGGETINTWIVDLGSIFDGINQSIPLNFPVQYNGVEGRWFDDGNLVFTGNYLSSVLSNSTSEEIGGIFNIGLGTNGDLGAFGNGIDTFVVSINVTAIPEPSFSLWTWILPGIGMAIGGGKNIAPSARE